jgi:hypothetical protein
LHAADDLLRFLVHFLHFLARLWAFLVLLLSSPCNLGAWHGVRRTWDQSSILWCFSFLKIGVIRRTGAVWSRSLHLSSGSLVWLLSNILPSLIPIGISGLLEDGPKRVVATLGLASSAAFAAFTLICVFLLSSSPILRLLAFFSHSAYTIVSVHAGGRD